MLSKKLKERQRKRSEVVWQISQGAWWEWVVFVEPAFLDTSGDEQHLFSQVGVRWGEGERATVGMAGREAVPPSSAFFDGGRGSREGSLIGELPSGPDIMLWWRRRCQGAATAAVDYSSSS